MTQTREQLQEQIKRDVDRLAGLAAFEEIMPSEPDVDVVLFEWRAGASTVMYRRVAVRMGETGYRWKLVHDREVDGRHSFLAWDQVLMNTFNQPDRIPVALRTANFGDINALIDPKEEA